MQIRSLPVTPVGGNYSTETARRVEKEEGKSDSRENRDHPQDSPDRREEDAPKDILELSDEVRPDLLELPLHAVVYEARSSPKPVSAETEAGAVIRRLDLQA